MIMRTPVEARPLNERIRWARERTGMSQEKFAEAAGTSRRHVMRWEKPRGTANAHSPNAHYRRIIAEVTGQPESLFTDDEPEPGL